MTPPAPGDRLPAASGRPPDPSAVDGPAFLHLVTHDLRAPVAAVRTMVSLLTQGHLGDLHPSHADLLGRIERRLESLQALLDDLIDLAALRASVPADGPVDLQAAARDACSRFEGRARAAGSRLVLEATDLVWAAIAPADLELVLHHLIDNAVKYGRGGPVVVRVGQVAEAARVTVADSGIGIPGEARCRLFEPLFRAPNAEALAPGSGLGLLVVREAAERCGGTVAIESVEGQGTTVTVRLPLAGLSVGGSS